MPVVTQRAPLELKQAVDTVEQADRRWRDDGDREEAQHDAYLAERRAAIAENYARARDADENIKLANATADKQRLEARTREATVARQEANQQAQRADSADERVRQLEARVRDIQAQQTERGLLVTLGDVLFETGKAQLLSPAFPRLDKLAEFLRQYPDRRLLIEGYTDSVGSDSYNLELSQRRAEAVRLALIQRGIDPGRIAIRGYGESYPVADNANTEGRALNRRVEVVITDERGNLRPRG
jgi:outer membrane protein OmpA-like peptidoglycan-associated protein